jgi:hypothetical protein
VIAVEAGIAVAFVVVAAAGVTRPTWLLVAGLAGHQVKDLWPHRHYVANTRWWPPFCWLWVGGVPRAFEVADILLCW